MRVYIIPKKIFIGMVLLTFLFIILSVFYAENNMNTFFIKSTDEPIRSGESGSNKMAFTCNVDWGNEVIPRLLDILEKENIKITFFITGRWAENNSQMVKLIYSKGHEIGNHGFSHKMHSKISEKENYSEIKKTEDVIIKILGFKPRYFAPPSGDFNKTTLDVASRLGYATILWNIDTIDWRVGSTKDVIIDRVMKKPHGGGILLMHPKEATIEALPYLIEKIKEEGVQIGTISDLLQ